MNNQLQWWQHQGFTEEQVQQSRDALKTKLWFLMREFSVPLQRVLNLGETMATMLPSPSKCWTYRGNAGKTTFPASLAARSQLCCQQL
eukprot:799549-Amphidinium_carterae.1